MHARNVTADARHPAQLEALPSPSLSRDGAIGFSEHLAWVLALWHERRRRRGAREGVTVGKQDGHPQTRIGSWRRRSQRCRR